jgi:alkylresorcinol/alkylpyrone synthase
MQIASVGTALPPHRYEQDDLIRAFTRLWSQQHHNPARVEQLHRAVQVGGRNLALPMEAYEALQGFGDANDAFIRVGLDLAEAAVREALDRAGLAPTDVDLIVFTTVTGVAAPSLDARLVNRLGLRTDVKRLPLFGLGCVAGTAGVARLHDYLTAYPDQVAILVSVELCSLTLQRRDLSIPNLIATGLFGDGASCVVAVGSERADAMPLGPGRAGPRIRATRSRFYPDTESTMGWEVGDGGFQIVLAAHVPDLVARHLGEDVAGFLADHGRTRQDITSWVCHPGGPKVLHAFTDALDLGPDDLAITWRSLEEIGNLSSSSVLFVLRDTLAEHRPPAGAHGLMIAMGPGFCSELVLLEW